MAPAKKTAHKAAKKSAKKAASKQAGQHEPGKEVRRAYEHLGRVQSLNGLLPAEGKKHVSLLARMAQQELAAGEHRAAAELLRAAEHLGFGALAINKADRKLDPMLQQALEKEFAHRMHKAQKHWAELENPIPRLAQVFATAIVAAQIAMEIGAFCRALELARGAEAIAQARVSGAPRLADGVQSGSKGRLKR